jgi:hypothetical protein
VKNFHKNKAYIKSALTAESKSERNCYFIKFLFGLVEYEMVKDSFHLFAQHS